MKFYLTDRIVSLEPGQGEGEPAFTRIVTTKALSLAEEYLADHFPAFPVLPGVLMIEAMVQSAAWLARLDQDYAKSVIVLSRARNVRYGSFVSPGKTLRCEVETMSITPELAKVKAAGYIDDKQAVTGRLELACFNLADRKAYLAESDAEIVAEMKRRFRLMGGPEALAAAR